PTLYYLYTICASFTGERKVLNACRNDRDVSAYEEKRYHFPVKADLTARGDHIVIIGAGPAGLFCAYELALAGFCPVLLERGGDVAERTRAVEAFWEGGELLYDCNVQFGEGGAGAFSDGKLNTLVKDDTGRNRRVLETFVKFGADPEILYSHKPHVGTDVLREVVANLRNAIIAHGGSVQFHSQVTDIVLQNGAVKELVVNHDTVYPASRVVLAIGHSARDTFAMLRSRGLSMESKAFAVGYRVIHPQAYINQMQYGMKDPGEIGAAPYKVTAKSSDGRGVYSFCMCPGGYVVNASSEDQRTAVNGMSYSGRDGDCANSAMIVSVTPEDIRQFEHGFISMPAKDPALIGLAFQREMEARAYQAGCGKVPIQKYGEFKKELQKRGMIKETKTADLIPAFTPAIKGLSQEADLCDVMPPVLQKAFVEGMEEIGHKIPGFASGEVILCGVESRTSSPVRIPRDEHFQSAFLGLYPCGEGAGYAGGITSAAMDGIKVAEQVALQILQDRHEER
ncbi:MAG: NAD(P)-binding protein, partial [Lachnospiraceae bacterium]|nr:NAD(P)-binding protein [Lachnospiraceae bacterium]